MLDDNVPVWPAVPVQLDNAKIARASPAAPLAVRTPRLPEPFPVPLEFFSRSPELFRTWLRHDIRYPSVVLAATSQDNSTPSKRVTGQGYQPAV